MIILIFSYLIEIDTERENAFRIVLIEVMNRRYSVVLQMVCLC